MRIVNAYRILPVYTADVSGVCSALYEMGGMIVMHDPSGCNSTYNTHDETRWYDKDSLIYITGLTEIDAVMGDDDRMIRNVVDASKRLNPKFIALAGSPVPFLNGTDFKAIGRLIEKKTGIPTFAMSTNGMHDYVQGAGEALLKVGMGMIKEPVQTEEKTVNVLGMTPLDFCHKSSTESIRRIMNENGFTVKSIWAMDSSEEEWMSAANASVNLVVSSVGLPLAKAMYEAWKIPYVVGAPIGAFTDDVIRDLMQAMRDGEPKLTCLNRNKHQESDTVIIGEPVTMGSLAAAIEREYGITVQLACPIEKCAELLTEGDVEIAGEDAVTDVMNEKKAIIADTLYQLVSPAGKQFYPLPHEAFSGRSYWCDMQNLFELELGGK